MLNKIFKRKNKGYKMEGKIELFRTLVCEIDIKKYSQKEYIKIVNLLYQDIFRNL